MTFQVGDKVRIYGKYEEEPLLSAPASSRKPRSQPSLLGQSIGSIRAIYNEFELLIKLDSFDRVIVWAHPKQCRKLVGKRPKTIWVRKSLGGSFHVLESRPIAKPRCWTKFVEAKER